jgi:hypothetical protein
MSKCENYYILGCCMLQPSKRSFQRKVLSPFSGSKYVAVETCLVAKPLFINVCCVLSYLR